MRGTLVAIAVAVAALADLWVALRPDPAELPAEVMQAGLRAVREAQKPGDLVVHSPLFRMSELVHLGDLRASSHVPAPKLAASRRVVVLDRTDVRMYVPGSADRVIDVPGGALEVRIYEPSGAFDVATWSLRDALSPSSMRIERPIGNVEVRCTGARSEGGYSCPGAPEWLYAQARSLRIGGEDTPCVWAHPTTADGAVVFEVPAQAAPPAGRRLVLAVSAGMTDDAVNQTPDGAAVTTAVVQGGREVGRVVAPNRVGWHKAEVSIDPGQVIELRVTAPRDGRRHHCLNAEVLDVDAKAGSGAGVKEGAR
ncbi:hypothetical protein L6R52_09235 [Myxococcota bacterium]|nr:hypothetical protein [Myxococcota bacterium]